MNEDVMDLPFEADLLEEGLALLPPRTTEYRAGDRTFVPASWDDEPATLPIPLSVAIPTPLAPPAVER